MTNDERFTKFIQSMEEEVVSLLALDDKVAKKFTGRAEGPTFVLRNALENEQGGTRRTTSVSRAWRRTAGWLDDLLKADQMLAREEAVHKLLNYRHPAPLQLKATPEQLEGFRMFSAWRKQISREMLTLTMWVEALKKAAVANAEIEERAAQQASLMRWTKWIHEGPASGLRRQHRFSRNVKGWTPTAKSSGVDAGIDVEDELEGLEGISIEELNLVRFEQSSKGTPAAAQQEADDEAEAWKNIWGAGTKQEELQWPMDMGEELPAMMVDELREACLTFPTETGLGWDLWHPRVLLRLSHATMLLLVTILMECEKTGEWPAGVALVLIALLPKTDGTFRAIGLLPSPPRVWMRARRKLARRWEEQNTRTWLYAGKGKGANVAGWKQAAAAELAATMRTSVEYVQTLLDLVKAFDKIPLWLLVQEAIALGYPLRMLRLSIATYQLKRVIRIGTVVSKVVTAITGITAGSGFATSEMRLVMVRVIDRALKLYPAITPTLFVDDLAAEVSAPCKQAIAQMGGFIEYVAEFVNRTKQALSDTKSNITASSKWVADVLVERWSKKGIVITFKPRVKALGVGLGAGVRRNATVMRTRLKNFTARLPRFRRLRKVGVNTARLVRTGMRAMTYSNAILGVPCGLLNSQRSAAAAAAAPGAGTGGQNLDLALLVADGSKSGRADPAYDAHALPIGEWAMAVWESWMPVRSMQRIVDDAVSRLDRVKNKWAVCYGPGAAMVMTCRRLNWTAKSATKLITDTGELLNLILDPPKVVVNHVYAAVQRWRWRRVEKQLPKLASSGTGRGPLIEPIWQLLSTKSKEQNWTAAHKGCLQSVMANRQFTQSRVMQCGWAKHDRCLLCLSRIVDAECNVQGGSKRTMKDAVEATADQISKAPRGDLVHRLWGCQVTKPVRDELAPEHDVRTVADVDVRGHPAWERALVTRPSLPLKRRSLTETFNWHVKPKQLPVAGRVYPDGSARDGPTPELVRCGWGFAILDVDGKIIASAYGVPPPWITDIGGSEAWALYQSLLCSIPELCEYWPDCYPVKLAVDKGAAVALDPRNPLARVHGMIHTALEGVNTEVVGWMPAHLTKADLGHGMAKKSNGEAVTEQDQWGNDVADKLAKLGAEHHRVPPEEVRIWKKAQRVAKDRAKWIGQATYAANNSDSFPFRDNEASRWKAAAAQRRRQNKKAGIDGRRRKRGPLAKQTIPVSKGGHRIVAALSGGGWLCTHCKCRSAVRRKLSTTRCGGQRATVLPRTSQLPGPDRQHRLIDSGTVQWCGTCGCFAESRRTKRMQAKCPGPPPKDGNQGGVRQQLMELRSGKHPVTGMRLPMAIDSEGNAVQGEGTYAILQAKATPNTNFARYVPEELPQPKPAVGQSASTKRQLMIERIRSKLAKERKRVRRLRKMDALLDLQELISTFVSSVEAESPAPVVEVATDDGDCSDADFWSQLPTADSRVDHLASIPVTARPFPGRMVSSRSRRLG